MFVASGLMSKLAKTTAQGPKLPSKSLTNKKVTVSYYKNQSKGLLLESVGFICPWKVNVIVQKLYFSVFISSWWYFDFQVDKLLPYTVQLHLNSKREVNKNEANEKYCTAHKISLWTKAFLIPELGLKSLSTRRRLEVPSQTTLRRTLQAIQSMIPPGQRSLPWAENKSPIRFFAISARPIVGRCSPCDSSSSTDDHNRNIRRIPAEVEWAAHRCTIHLRSKSTPPEKVLLLTH